MSKNTIVLMIYPHGVIVPYKINPRDEFFVINEARAVGVYLINDKYRFMWNGRTPIYIYAVGNFTPIDPLMIDGLNQYKKANRLTIIRQKDVRHGSMIRHMMNRLSKDDIMKTLDEQMAKEGGDIQTAVTTVMNDLKNEIQFKREKHGQDIEYSPEQKAVIIINYLKQLQLISEDEFSNLIHNVANEKLSFETLIEELKYRQIVSVAEPLPEQLEDFLQDF